MPTMVTPSCIPAKYKVFTIWSFLERGGKPSDAREGIVDGLQPLLDLPSSICVTLCLCCHQPGPGHHHPQFDRL